MVDPVVGVADLSCRRATPATGTGSMAALDAESHLEH